MNQNSGKVILLAAKNTGDIGDKILEVVESIVPEYLLEVVNSVKALSNKLQQHMGTIEVAILLAETHTRLKDIIKLNKYLKNIRLILILPDRSDKTMSNGFVLRPRFIDYIDSDLDEFSAVLQKITLKETNSTNKDTPSVSLQ